MSNRSDYFRYWCGSLGLLLMFFSALLLAQTADEPVDPNRSARVQPATERIATQDAPVESILEQAPTPRTTHTLSGQVRLVDEQGQVITKDIDLSDAVVYFKPEAQIEWQADVSDITLTTQRRRFVPSVVVVEAGSQVRFPNTDPILHNVFSSSPGNRFDLGLYGRSDGEVHQFDDPGLVRVFCNVHPAMSAHIVVVDTPFHLRPDNQGRFSFDELPSGAGKLTAWHERSDPVQINVNLIGEHVELQPIDLRATVRRIAPQRERLRRRRRRRY